MTQVQLEWGWGWIWPNFRLVVRSYNPTDKGLTIFLPLAIPVKRKILLGLGQALRPSCRWFQQGHLSQSPSSGLHSLCLALVVKQGTLATGTALKPVQKSSGLQIHLTKEKILPGLRQALMLSHRWSQQKQRLQIARVSQSAAFLAPLLPLSGFGC